MKRDLRKNPVIEIPCQQFTDPYLQEYLTGKWELVGIQCYNQ